MKSIFSRLFERSAEVLALYSLFHCSLSRGGIFIRRGLSFIARWTVLPYFESEHGYIDKNGKVIVKPKYGEGYEFEYGVAHVSISDENIHGWGYVNKKGKEIFMHRDFL